jgi:DNA-binding GntR family transcriptional regulator
MPRLAISLSRLPQTTLAEQVYLALRERLLSDEAQPGEYMREVELSEALGVSRTPVREALSRLASEGFLERVPQRGVRVPERPFRDQLELFPIVSALEMLAGELALPQLGEKEIARLKQINVRMRAARRARDAALLADLNNRFHHLFCQGSGNKRLTELLDGLRVQTLHLDLWYYSSDERAEQSIQEHDEMIAAVEARNFRKALAIVRTNFALTRQTLAAESRLDVDGDGAPALDGRRRSRR